MQPWRTIEQTATPEGALELRQRGQRDFLITIGGRVLMTSAAHRSEDQLAELACAALEKRSARAPRTARGPIRLLLGGLGMAYTLRAALDRLPASAEVVVVDLNPSVVAWCRGPLAALTGGATDDRRVTVQIADVARVLAASPPGHYDAIVLDLYDGPRAGVFDPLYREPALKRAWAALRTGGVAAIWSEEADRSFEARLTAAGFTVERHRGGGRGGRAHFIYVGTRREGWLPSIG
jgi:spermidine synthase